MAVSSALAACQDGAGAPRGVCLMWGHTNADFRSAVSTNFAAASGVRLMVKGRMKQDTGDLRVIDYHSHPHQTEN